MSGRKRFQTEGTASAKTPRLDPAWCFEGRAWRPEWLEQSEKGGVGGSEPRVVSNADLPKLGPCEGNGASVAMGASHHPAIISQSPCEGSTNYFFFNIFKKIVLI